MNPTSPLNASFTPCTTARAASSIRPNTFLTAFRAVVQAPDTQPLTHDARPVNSDRIVPIVSVMNVATAPNTLSVTDRTAFQADVTTFLTAFTPDMNVSRIVCQFLTIARTASP